MLSNVRIKDTRRLTAQKESVGNSVKKRPRPKAKTSQLSPFSQLTLALKPSLSPSLSPSSTNNSRIDALTEAIRGCSLHDNLYGGDSDAGTPQSPRPVPGVGHSVRPDRRSLKQQNAAKSAAPADENLRRHHDTSPGDVKRVTLTPRGAGSPSLTPLTPLQPHEQPLASPLLHYLSPVHSVPLSPREKVLALCEQTHPLPLNSFFSDQVVQTTKKLGEGTFAEVFGSITENGKSLAIKIIPIEGTLLYNDEPQSTYQDILTEMVITKELSLLGEKLEAKENKSMTYFTENFLSVDRLVLCEGEYPAILLEAWDAWASLNRTENDRPDGFPAHQLYVVMTTENAGTSLENYKFSSVEEALSVLCQVAGSLAVGEAALEMEHRDLHTSNVLVKEAEEEYFLFVLDGEQFLVPSHGVKATIVDYTLSRVKQGDFVSFNDLERLSWLFEGDGDIQYDVYRDMKKATGSQWDQFCPHTNVLWLAYLVTKLSDRVMVVDRASRRSWRAGLRPLVRNISRFSSAQDAFINLFLSQISTHFS